MRTQRVTRAVVALATLAAGLAGAVGVAGCSGDQGRDATGTTTTRSSYDASTAPTAGPTSAPTSSPAGPPKQADRELDSARTFIRRWAAAERDMENTGRTRAYRALTDGCRACDKLAATVERYYAAGGDIRWDGWVIDEIRRHQGRREFLVVVDSEPARYRERKGGRLKRFIGGPSRWIIELRKDGRSWVVTAKKNLDPVR